MCAGMLIEKFLTPLLRQPTPLQRGVHFPNPPCVP